MVINNFFRKRSTSGALCNSFGRRSRHAQRPRTRETRMSTSTFEPIEGVGCRHRTLHSAAPVAVRRENGVDLSNYYKSELQAYTDARPGEAARHVRAQIFERRGGVLPRNWTVVEHYKANLDLLAEIRLKEGA